MSGKVSARRERGVGAASVRRGVSAGCGVRGVSGRCGCVALARGVGTRGSKA